MSLLSLANLILFAFSLRNTMADVTPNSDKNDDENIINYAFGQRVARRFDNLINAGDYAWNRLAHQDEVERRQLATVEIGVDGQFGFEQHGESEEGAEEGSDNYIRRRLSPANQKFFEEYLRERDFITITLHESVAWIWKDGHSVSEPAIASQNDDNQIFPRRLTDGVNVQSFDFQLQLGTSQSQPVHCLKTDETEGILTYRVKGKPKRFELKVDRNSQIKITNGNDFSITGLKKRELPDGAWEEAHTNTFKCDNDAKEKLNDWLQKTIKSFDIIDAAAAKQKEIECKSTCEGK